MNDLKEGSDSGETPFSDSAELFDSLFREANDADASDNDEIKAGLPSDSSDDVSRKKDKKVSGSDARDIAVKFWKYLNKDSKDTFLDADIKDASRSVLDFLNRDVIGKKIVFLEDDKLKTVNVVARALKRKRNIIKTDKEKSTIVQIRKIQQYLNNPFWQNCTLIRKARKYLDKNLRAMTPSIVRSLTADVARLRPYFNGVILDDTILETDRELKNMSMRFGCRQFAVCEKHQQALVKNETGDILCIYTDCGTGRCPFDVCKAHGEEVDFLSDLRKLLLTTDVIKDNRVIRDDL
ncbi:hypothetical protein OAC89_04545 [Deltaproteobacteria bacterium]|nr:hypothetical protein [Deltaproteobacteria bacterium]